MAGEVTADGSLIDAESLSRVRRGAKRASESARLDALKAEEQRLLAEYQRAFDESSGMTKAQIKAAGDAYAAAQRKVKAFKEAASC